METPNNLILPALILVPFIAGFICWLVDKLDDKLPRYIALVGMLVTLGLTVALWQGASYNYELGAQVPTWSAEFMLPWITNPRHQHSLSGGWLIFTHGGFNCITGYFSGRLFIW